MDRQTQISIPRASVEAKKELDIISDPLQFIHDIDDSSQIEKSILMLETSGNAWLIARCIKKFPKFKPQATFSLFQDRHVLPSPLP